MGNKLDTCGLGLALLVGTAGAIQGADVTGARANIGGGHTLTGTAATITGGSNNLATASYAVVGGGLGNNNGGSYSFIGSGSYNYLSGASSVIAGGDGNTSTNSYSVIGGGVGNVNYSIEGVIAGGEGNFASEGWSTTISGGIYNTVSGSDGSIGGGANNVVSGVGGTVPGGINGNASHYGQMAYSSGGFTAIGDAQTSLYVARRSTTNGTPTELFLDGSSARMTIATNATWTFDALVVARGGINGTNSAGYRIVGVIKNNAGNTAFIGTPTVTTLGEDVAAWNATAVADNTNDALVLQVTGSTNTTVRWVGSVRTTEVAY
jgi:hypothetical protein